jgi:endogenous inhibitor of DNA gyrase (YacG/DUF329 family)
MKRHIMLTKVCEECGTEFQTYFRKQRFCSLKCSGIHLGRVYSQTRFKGVVKVCTTCGKDYKVSPSIAGKSKFCSHLCWWKYRFNAGLRTCEQCGKQFHRHYPKQKFCSNECWKVWLSITHEGGRNPQYRNQYKDFTKSVKTKVIQLFGNKCIICGWDKAPNDICHIIPASNGGKAEISNLFLLCPNHHRMYDRKLITREEILSRLHSYLIPDISK